MRAIVLHETGGPEKLIFETVPEPKLTCDDDVRIRIHASAVCGRDLIDRRGEFPLMKRPTILGHEFAGEIVEVGAQARGAWSVGNRVVNLHRPFCGACPRCLGGQMVLCERALQSFGHTVDGGYAEQVVAHQRALVQIPDGLEYDAASTLMCTAGAALYALRTRAKLAMGESVLITGASGGVGAAAIQLAKHMGAYVIASTSQARKVEALEKLGADEVVVGVDRELHRRVKRGPRGPVDVVLELTGSVTFNAALRSLRRGGRMVIIGNIDTEKISLNLGAIILYGYEIYGSASCTHRDLSDVLLLARDGHLRATIDRKLPLEQAAAAHELLAQRAVVGRIVLET